MLLTGTFTRSLDEKQRFNVPKPVRDVLLQGAEANTEKEAASGKRGSVAGIGLFLAPGTDGSLALYPEKAFVQLAERLSRNPPTGQDVRAFSRLFYAQAQRVEMDGQGRVRVPVELAALGGLTKEVVLLGAGDRLEVWDRARWEAYLAQKQPRYDEIAERAFGSPGVQARQQESTDADDARSTTHHSPDIQSDPTVDAAPTPKPR